MASGFSNEFGDMFFSNRIIQCPYCQIKFSTIQQLKNHKESYCTPEENFEILDQMVDNVAFDIARNGSSAMLNEKNVIILKGLYFLKSEWETYRSYINDPKGSLLNEQKAKKQGEENTRKPHFEAMFSDFNPDADNIKKYPVLEGHLDREYGENLGSFGIIGEDTNPDGKKDPNIPSWM